MGHTFNICWLSPGCKAYKLYNLQERTFFISRDVVFHEETFSFHVLPQLEQLVDPFPDLVLHIPVANVVQHQHTVIPTQQQQHHLAPSPPHSPARNIHQQNLDLPPPLILTKELL